MNREQEIRQAVIRLLKRHELLNDYQLIINFGSLLFHYKVLLNFISLNRLMTKVLVIDDDPDVRTVMIVLMKQHGYGVETAFSREDALDKRIQPYHT